MKRFQFPLERILQIRHHVEKQWEVKLAEITGQCLVIQNNIQTMESQKKINLTDLSEHRKDLSFDILQSHQLFAHKLDQDIREQGRLLQKMNEKREKIQKHYIEVSQKRKVLEKLKEKRENEYYKQALLADFKEMDDLSTQKYIRKINQENKGDK